MKSRRLLVLSAIALALACEGHQTPTGPSVPFDPSKIISDGAHGGNPDFFFLPPLVPSPVNDPNYEKGKFNATLGPSLTVEICQLQGAPVDAQGLPVATDCVAGDPVKKFAAGTVRLLGSPDGFYQVLWNTRESTLDVTKFYRIKVMVEGSSIPFGAADVDPVSNMKEFKNVRTGEVIPLNDDSTLPIKFRIEKGGGPTLCGSGSLCASASVTNDNPNGDSYVLPVQGNNGPIAGVVLPDGWLPVGPGLPTSVVVTISSVNTGVNDVAAGTQSNPCHAGLPLEQFNGCFKFTTTPTLDRFGLDGHQFAREVTVVTCYVLHDNTVDTREPWVQLWSSGPDEPAHPLKSAPDALVLTVPSEHNCGSNFETVVIGSNTTGSNALTQLASAGWRTLKRSVGRILGVKTAYAVDLGLGGLTLDFSNVGPALTAQIQRHTSTDLALGTEATTTSTVRIVGTRQHNNSALSTGIGGLPVTFTVAPGNGTLRLIGSEAPPASQVTSITNTNPIVPGSPTSGGGFAPVNWTMPTTPGTYTLTATGPATGGPVTFTATVTGTGIPLSSQETIFNFDLTSHFPAPPYNAISFAVTFTAADPVAGTDVLITNVYGGASGTQLLQTRNDTGIITAGGTMYGPLTTANAIFNPMLDGIFSFGLVMTSGTAVVTEFKVCGVIYVPFQQTCTSIPVVGFTFLQGSLSAGPFHTCGLTSGGGAFCWGWNARGQLGDGTTTGRTTPVVAAGGMTFASVRGGAFHTCGLTSGGAAYCWGDNQFGQLGDGSTINRTTPVAVAGGITFASLDAGQHTCGVTSGGAAYCWGDNENGQLGDGTTTNRTTPVAVVGGFTFARVTPGVIHTCGLTRGGAAYCWGWNANGELGDGTTTDRATPVAVAGGVRFASVTPSERHTCGLTSGGAAYCWGDNNVGALGDGTTTGRTTPVAVAGGLTFVSLTAGENHTCALTSGGAAYCWGYNVYGQLGDGSTTLRITPVAVAGSLTFASLTAGAGGHHTCGLTSGGAAYCWGNNGLGQLGDGSTINRTTPVAVVNP